MRANQAAGINAVVGEISRNARGEICASGVLVPVLLCSNGSATLININPESIRTEN